MLPKHFYAMAHGYLVKEYKQNRELRKMSFYNLLPYLKPDVTFFRFCENYWPLAFDEEFMPKPEPRIIRTREEIDRIMAIHNPKRYGQRVKTTTE